MRLYARQALPWLLLCCCAVLVLVAMSLLASRPHALWPLQGLAVAVLGAAGAWAVDEPAAAVVDTTPRGLGWRTAARALGVLPLLALWIGLATAFRGSLFGHAADVATQGCVALLAGCALGTRARCRGAAVPGQRIAVLLLLMGGFLAAVRRVQDWLPVFPYLETGAWDASRLGWALAGLLAAAVLLHSLTRTGPRAVRR